MIKVTFNDKMGTRERECHFGVVHKGQAYDRYDAEEKKLAIFRRLKYEKKGKWSNSDWEVVTRSAKPFVFMRPFEGWPESLPLAIQAVKESCRSYIGVELTDEEAEAAFKLCCPGTYKKLREKDELENELV